MRALLLAMLVISISACSLTPTQKKWAGVAAGVLIVGAIAAHDSKDDGSPVAHDTAIGGGPGCRPQPDGSCR